MRVWRKTQRGEEDGGEIIGVARAAVRGKSRRRLLKEALNVLLGTGKVDRAGAWVDTGDHGDSGSGEIRVFRGAVEDREGTATPAEWSNFSPEALLPAELLVHLQSVEQELGESGSAPLIGPLIEMRRALWVPLTIQGHLGGVLFAGGRKRQTPLPRALAEALAAELTLAIELEEERRLRHCHHEDARITRSTLRALPHIESLSQILDAIVSDCTRSGMHGNGPGALFAVVGRLSRSSDTTQETSRAANDGTRVEWHSSDNTLIRVLESGPVSGIWRRALESHQVAGGEPAARSAYGNLGRVVAFPLEAGAQRLGVLVAGIPRSESSLAIVERLELRAALAASALFQLKQSEHIAELESRRKDAAAAVEKPSEPTEHATPKHGIADVLNVIEWLEEGVVLTGPRQEIRAVNSRFAQMLGLAPDELAQIKTRDDLVGAVAARSKTGDAFGKSGRGLDLTPGPVREELHLVRPVPRLLERAARPLFDENGALLGQIEIYRDLTAQRLFQSKLLQTEKLAELGQRVTGIAHEMSNPLTSILGYAQRLLLRRDPSGDSYEARQIFQEAERASAILRQLLFSARDTRPERRRVALNRVVSRTLELLRFSPGGNLHVQLDLDPVLPFVQGDAGQLQQVLMNLVGNARQAIEEQGKGGTITLKTRRIGDARILLQVSDDGPGIPHNIQARIFDPFFTTKPPGVGTGLGLPIVLGIVREHGGKLHLTSNLGRGTVFSIELPVMAAVQMPLHASGRVRTDSHALEPLPAADSLETVHAGAALSAWAGTRVLVLEDEPTVARLIADVLEDEGLRVDVLMDAREALSRTERENYDLVICDMKMPELDGEQFYQALARAKNPLRERFLFVTGDVLAVHTRNFLERNHLPHVAKPFRVEELTEKVHGVLETTSARAPSRAPAEKKNAARK